jgi:hypothetical protein
LHPMCCRACRQSIADLFASVDECLQAMEAMKQRIEDLERVVEATTCSLTVTCANFLAWLETCEASGAILA